MVGRGLSLSLDKSSQRSHRRDVDNDTSNRLQNRTKRVALQSDHRDHQEDIWQPIFYWANDSLSILRISLSRRHGDNRH